MRFHLTNPHSDDHDFGNKGAIDLVPLTLFQKYTFKKHNILQYLIGGDKVISNIVHIC